MKLVEVDFEDTKQKLRLAYKDYRSEKHNWTVKQKESTEFTKQYLFEANILDKLIGILGE